MSSGDGPRSIPSVMTSMFERATRKWTRQRRSEERHPGNVRYRVSRMTKVARITQKEVAWAVMEQCYRAVSGLRNLPAKVRQIFYRARPKIMAETDDRELAYNYFSQTLLPDYVEEHGCEHWNVVWDARGHFEPAHQSAHWLRHARSAQLSRCDQESKYRLGGLLRRRGRDHRPGRRLQCRHVLREGGLRSAVQGGQPRQPPRPDDHLEQGPHRRCCQPPLKDDREARYCEYRSQWTFPSSSPTLAIWTNSSSEHPRAHLSHCCFLPKSRAHSSAPANTIWPLRAFTPALMPSVSLLLGSE